MAKIGKFSKTGTLMQFENEAERKKKARAAEILGLLKKRYPTPASLLEFHNPWELMVATVLAAQCTDARVNQVTPKFFLRWPNPEALARAAQSEIEEVIHSTGLFRNKAKNLLAGAKWLKANHNGILPKTIAELVKIPGIARKTANIILWGGFGINEGLAVDTHVKRIAFRLGLTENTDPVKVERDLMPLFPQQEWGNGNHRLVWFGRDVCQARKPRCPECELRPVCPQCGLPQTAKRNVKSNG